VRAAVQYGYGSPLVVEELEVDPPRAGEVLVRMAASGVCRSDWHEVRGIHRHPVPGVLGHEGSGVIEEVGPGVEGLAPGDHVVLSWLPYCGTCRRCASGRPNLCENLGAFDAGYLADGTVRFHKGDLPIHTNVPSSFAERTVVPANTAIRVDPSLPLEQVALLGCAVMTGVGAVLNTAGVRPGESVVVIGCGGVGLSVIQGARIAGASPIVAVDVVPSKLDLARDLGATDTVLGASGDPEVAVRRVLPDGADHAFEALGRAQTIELATRVTGPGGTAVLVGMAAPDARPTIDALTITLEERRILGCWYGSCVPPRDFPRLVDLVLSGTLRLDVMIGRTFGLDGINDALALFEHGPEARSVIVYAG
jgi:S-(hydroxymethyl)glutathione dehydrogenase/alcohol dehydrogenase